LIKPREAVPTEARFFEDGEACSLFKSPSDLGPLSLLRTCSRGSQLAFHGERKIKPHRLSDSVRLPGFLVLW